MSKAKTDLAIQDFAKPVANKAKIAISSSNFVRYVEAGKVDTPQKKRSRRKMFSRAVFEESSNANVKEFRIDKAAIPTSDFKRESSIIEIRVLRIKEKHIITQITENLPAFAPIETGEGIVADIRGQTYQFNQTSETETLVTWPDGTTQTLTAGQTVAKNGLLFTAGSIIIENDGTACHGFGGTYRNCTTILNSYNSNGCCGAAAGQCATDVLEYNCAACCTS